MRLTLCLSPSIRRFILSLMRLYLGMLISVISGLKRLGFPRRQPFSRCGWRRRALRELFPELVDSVLDVLPVLEGPLNRSVILKEGEVEQLRNEVLPLVVRILAACHTLPFRCESLEDFRAYGWVRFLFSLSTFKNACFTVSI